MTWTATVTVPQGASATLTTRPVPCRREDGRTTDAPLPGRRGPTGRTRRHDRPCCGGGLRALPPGGWGPPPLAARMRRDARRAMIETLARLQAQRAAAVDRMASRHGGD